MSMTAERWWVRLAARWLARVEAVAPLIRMGMLTLTGLSTALVALNQYGHDQYARPLIGIIAVGTVAFTYLYTEHGVWNQQNRDKTDLGDNYSGPTMLMDKRIQARQLALLGYVMKNGDDKPFHEIEQELQDVTEEEWTALRDGVDVSEIEKIKQ